ncbi:MAG: UvrD-helicase domain-containing protein [Akkermansia sp.]
MYIAASAGAGKTYQLVGRFIALLCIQHMQQKEIGGILNVTQLIAITFTRKAAGEFKARILTDMAQAAKSEESARSFWQQRVLPSMRLIGFECPCPEQAQEFFLQILRELMKQFSALNLGTIDGLFQRMVRSLASELGLVRIQALDPSENDAMRRKALNDCYLSFKDGEAAEEDDAFNTLHEAVLASIGEEGRFNSPDQSIFDLICEFHELYLSSPHACWGGRLGELDEGQLALYGLSPTDLQASLSAEEIRQRVTRFNRLFVEDESALPNLEKIGSKGSLYQIKGSPLEINLHHSTAKVYRKKFIAFVQSLANLKGDIDFVTVKGEEGAIHMEEPMKESRYSYYWQLCLDAGIDLGAMVSSHRAINWQRLLQRTRAIQELLKQFEAVYQREVRQSGLYNFSDIERVLQGRVDEASFQLIQERLDAHLEHWLLDEFQDTSNKQYHILQDLLFNRAQSDENGSVFMVGDAKQSIYQFRGGDPKIFINTRSELFGLDTEGQQNSIEQPLNVSYRSAQEVLDLSNLVFGEHFEDNAQYAHAQSIDMWNSLDYQEHKANNTKLVGCADIWEYGLAETTSKNEEGVEDFAMSKDEALYRSMATMLTDKRPMDASNIPSCAILVSTKNEGKKIHDALKKLQEEEEYPFEGPVVLCDDRSVGQDSPLGIALMHLFRWLNSPGDQKSLAMLKLSPIWQRVQEMSQGQDCWLQLRSILEAGGFSHLLQELMREEFDEYGDPIDEPIICNDFIRQRWKTWLDNAASFDQSSHSISEWLMHMEKLMIREEPQGNAVRIMTIHKAKGLEFDMVLLPFPSRNRVMAEYHKQKLFTRKSNDGHVLCTTLPPRRQLVYATPSFEDEMVIPQLANEEFAGYCKLYVAMTRAKQACHILIPYKNKKASEPSGESLTSLLRTTIENSTKFQCEEDASNYITTEDGIKIARCNLRIGTADWYQAKANRDESPSSFPWEDRHGFPKGNYHFRSLPRSTPSSIDKDRRHDDTEPAPLTMRPLQQHTGAQFGTLVHEMLQDVTWLDEALPAWTHSDPRATSTAQGALNSPAWAPYFTRPDGDCLLYREQNIEALMDGRWVSGQIDRMVVHYAAGRDKPATSAHIMDFKTDANLSAAEGKAHYRAQMQAYRSMVALAFDLAPEQVQVTLLHCPAQGEPEAWDFSEKDWH